MEHYICNQRLKIDYNFGKKHMTKSLKFGNPTTDTPRAKVLGRLSPGIITP